MSANIVCLRQQRTTTTQRHHYVFHFYSILPILLLTTNKIRDKTYTYTRATYTSL
jgi:hypothetical protein